MTTQRTFSAVSRRTAVTGLGASGLALAASRLGVAAQEATPPAMAGHPMVGTWVVDRIVGVPAEPPTTNVLTADGGLADSSAGADGVWEATGPTTANYTLIVISAADGTYSMIRGSLELDETGDTATASYSRTIVTADGTVVDQMPKATAKYIRLRIEPQDAVGKPFTGFPAWKPAPPTATPTS